MCGVNFTSEVFKPCLKALCTCKYCISTCSYRIRPRFLRDVSKVDISTRLLGEEVAFPVGVSPTAAQCMAHPEGEAGTAKGKPFLGAKKLVQYV